MAFKYAEDWAPLTRVAIKRMSLVGTSLNLAKATAQRLLEKIRSRTMQVAETLYAEIDAENTQIAHGRPELSATMAGESRCLRAVMHTVLKEMTKQIA